MNKMPAIPHVTPIAKPHPISMTVCCRTIIRAVPNMPERNTNPQSQYTGLKLNMKLSDNNPPTISPQLATCVLIFQRMLMIAHSTMHTRHDMMMPDTQRGKCIRYMV